MKRNTKRKAIFASAFRRGAGGSGVRRPALVWTARAAVAAAACVCACLAFARLRALAIEQCVLADVSRQVSITTGESIKPGLVLERFGLTNGANLATIDFAAKRDETLSRIPNIRSLTISRRPPDRVEIVIVEREPVARMNTRGGRAETGRVVDSQGVVFARQRGGTALLPAILEQEKPVTPPGRSLEGRARAALEVICACQDEEFGELKILYIDTTRRDFLLAGLGDYSEAKIAWEGMDGPPSEASAAVMREQLSCLLRARRAAPMRVRMWNATIRGRAFADTKEPIT